MTDTIKKDTTPKKAFTVPEFCERNNVGRDTVYGEIRTGRLRARKINRKTLILDVDEDAWRASLPVLQLPAA
jgi:hypothetical protein